MDPVTAFGLASGVVGFITFSTSLVKGAIKIHESLDGNLDQNQSRQAIASEMERFATQMIPPDSSRLAGEEKALCVLATECRDLSFKLVELLERIKAKNPQSKSQSLWSALKNKVKETERADLEQRLDHCRSQLGLLLVFDSKSLLNALIESAKGDAAKLEQLRNNVEQLRQGVQVAGIGPEAQEQIRHLVDVQENALSAVAQSRIVKSLAFDGMYGRSEMVEEAHSRTFRWILDDSDDSHAENDNDTSVNWATHRTEQDKMRSAAREKFKNWLSSGEGIFHVSGKMGSGKSTLMKYLGDHPKTLAELTKWASKQPDIRHIYPQRLVVLTRTLQTAKSLWLQDSTFGQRVHRHRSRSTGSTVLSSMTS